MGRKSTLRAPGRECGDLLSGQAPSRRSMPSGRRTSAVCSSVAPNRWCNRAADGALCSERRCSFGVRAPGACLGGRDLQVEGTDQQQGAQALLRRLPDRWRAQVSAQITPAKQPMLVVPTTPQPLRPRMPSMAGRSTPLSNPPSRCSILVQYHPKSRCNGCHVWGRGVFGPFGPWWGGSWVGQLGTGCCTEGATEVGEAPHRAMACCM